MRVSNLCWTAFRLPFHRKFATARAAFAYREGVILQLRTDAGIIGLGEASPLPESGTQTLRRALAILETVTPSLRGRRLDELELFLDTRDQDVHALAAVRCALDVAARDATAKVAGITVAGLLARNVSQSVAVNATIGAYSTADACQVALKAQAAGFACVKLKVGMARSIDEECERVAAVRDVLGSQVKLRVDANGAWGVEQAIRTIQALEVYDLEFIEQPVSPGDLQGMERVREAVGTPIAADEDITDLDAARRVLQLGAAQVLVLKPMVIGGLRLTRQIIELAQAAGAAVVVTTTIDAGVGTAAALHLAATLPHGSPACGLATGDLLTSDLLVRPLAVSSGRMTLPEGPGLGIELDAAELRHYSPSKEEVSERVKHQE